MAEFKLNEEQEQLMKRLSDDVKNLKERYSNMNETFKITINIVKGKMSSGEDESTKDIKDKIEILQSQITSVIKELENVNCITRAYEGFTSATSFLLAVQSCISDVIYEFGKLEGYSLGEISTYGDKFGLTRHYGELKKSLLEE